MAQNKKSKKTIIDVQTEHRLDGSHSSLTDAFAYVYHQQIEKEIDHKTASSINSSLKGYAYVKFALPMKYMELVAKLHKQKIPVPAGILPEFTQTSQDSRQKKSLRKINRETTS